MSGPRCLTVRHKSTYRYSAPVSFGEHRMMFRPRSGHDLRLVTFQLSITPAPASLHWLHDVFDNSVAIATFSEEASQLRFDSTVTLEHYETPLPEYAIEPYAATWPFAYTNEEAAEAFRQRTDLMWPEDGTGMADAVVGPTQASVVFRVAELPVDGVIVNPYGPAGPRVLSLEECDRIARLIR